MTVLAAGLDQVGTLVSAGPLVLAVLVSVLAGFVSFASPCVVPLVPGYLSYRTGLSASELSSADGSRLRVLAGGLLFVFGFAIPFSLLGLLGGSLSNFADRVRQGYVTDFLDPDYWPAFNLGDVFITVGVAIGPAGGLTAGALIGFVFLTYRFLEPIAEFTEGAKLAGEVDLAPTMAAVTKLTEMAKQAPDEARAADYRKRADALLSAGVRRAVQLDINPEWVAGYLYVHRGQGLSAMQVTPSQPGIPGQLLSPYNRDFFTILAKAPMRQ